MSPTPRVYRTTLTAPRLFRHYLVDNFAVILRNHGGAIEVRESTTPIPLHFALSPTETLDGAAGEPSSWLSGAIPWTAIAGVLALGTLLVYKLTRRAAGGPSLIEAIRASALKPAVKSGASA